MALHIPSMVSGFNSELLTIHHPPGMASCGYGTRGLLYMYSPKHPISAVVIHLLSKTKGSEQSKTVVMLMFAGARLKLPISVGVGDVCSIPDLLSPLYPDIKASKIPRGSACPGQFSH